MQEILNAPLLSQVSGAEIPECILFWAEPSREQRDAIQATTTWIRAQETTLTLTWQLLEAETAHAEMLFFIQPVKQPKRRVIIRIPLPEWEFAVLNTFAAAELTFFLCPAPQSPAPHELVNTRVTYDMVKQMVWASLPAAITFIPDEKVNDGMLQLLTHYALINPASRLRDRLLK